MANGQVLNIAVTQEVCKAKHDNVDNQIADTRGDVNRVEKNVERLFDKIDSMNGKLWALLAAAVASVIGSLIIQIINK